MDRKEAQEKEESAIDGVALSVDRLEPSASTKSVHDEEAVIGVGRYRGQGTTDDPYVVDWDIGDTEDPYNWPKPRKWVVTMLLASSTFCISFGSSSYSGGIEFTMNDLHISQEVANLGISLYVLGFGLGPLLFAPLSEMHGRRIVFLCTYGPYTLMHLGGALAHNAATLLSFRLLAGILGSAPLTNAGGSIADMWNARERALAAAMYSTAPFLGPVIGPIIGGFVAENPKLDWRFNFWIMMIFSGFIYILGVLFLPETYAPVLIRRRARRLRHQSLNHEIYTSKYDLSRLRTLKHILTVDLSRPFILLFTEPIVTLLSIYIAIEYAILYALFSAFPIVFQKHHHFTAGQGGLAFLGVGVGIIIGTGLTPVQNKLYWRAMELSPNGRAPPEERLYAAMCGAIMLPIGLFWFAWTSQPPISPFVPIVASVPFGIGIAQILQSLTAYLMDAYTMYAASAIAATVVLRSALACAFPLFSPAMFAGLSDRWAMSVFAFLSLACMPLPMLFYKYGGRIRDKSNYAIKDGNEVLPSALNTPAPPTSRVAEKRAVDCRFT